MISVAVTLYDWLANTITSGLGKVLSLGLRKLILGLHTNEDPTGPVGWPPSSTSAP